jgi:lipid II:glycine glycyltransferase (peptidoglycan interpeptide bridge formation enzyme)
MVRIRHYSSYVLQTAGGEAGVWDRLHPSSTRRGIRKAEKEGVSAHRATSKDDWLEMARLEEETAHRHGVPAPPRRFFLGACRALQEDGLADLYLARLRGGGVAAGIVIWKGPREWIYAYGASRPESLPFRPNHMLLWTAIRDAIATGVSFDFGRAAPEQEGLVEFKRRWGGQPVPLSYDYWPSAGGLNVADRSRGPLALAARLWSRLPARLTRSGSFLYRYLG